MIAGISDEANYCPYCGEPIRAWGANGKSICGCCGAEFYVVEDDKSKREEALE